MPNEVSARFDTPLHELAWETGKVLALYDQGVAGDNVEQISKMTRAVLYPSTRTFQSARVRRFELRVVAIPIPKVDLVGTPKVGRGRT